MRISTKRALVAGAFFALVAVGLFIDTGLGTPCSFGWDFVASVCPVGVIAAMLAGRAVPVTGIICLGATVVGALVFGRAFCGWLCPVPLERRLFGGRRAVARSAAADSYVGQTADAGRIVDEAPARAAECARARRAESCELELAGAWRGRALGVARAGARSRRAVRVAARTRAELELACEWRGGALGVARTRARDAASCRTAPAERDLAACEWRGGALAPRASEGVPAARPARRGLGDIRAAVFVLAVLAALAFGFPVFCLVCPVGLTFASLAMFVQVVRTGVFTWAVVAFPALVVLELTLLRRWCHSVCPIGWVLSVVARGNRTLRPSVSASACLREQGGSCHACYKACPEGIDLHTPAGRARLNACTKCAECVFSCPVQAIEMPILPKR